MTGSLDIAITRERLVDGAPEEQATFGCFTMSVANALLTEGLDFYIKGYRPGPMVGGYYVAEWFLWNWWRLRWEPRTSADDWHLAHSMASIGDGYRWPNITIWSDGVRVALLAKPSAPEAVPFRYLMDRAVVVSAVDFERAVDQFLPVVLERVREAGLIDTNLSHLWEEVLGERADPALARFRKLEASLGYGPGVLDDGVVEGLLQEGRRYGVSALDEIAADLAVRQGHGDGSPPVAPAFEQFAIADGSIIQERDGIDLSPAPALGANDAPWRIARQMAAQVRAKASLGAAPITNARLAGLAGTSPGTIETIDRLTDHTFVLRGSGDGRLVLRSKWETGRRFDLARLIGDRLMFGRDEALAPATRAFTYRQKAQRAFATELLAPIDVLTRFLNGDFSDDRQREAAEYFQISEMAVENHLKNHRLIPRDGDGDFPEPLAA